MHAKRQKTKIIAWPFKESCCWVESWQVIVAVELQLSFFLLAGYVARGSLTQLMPLLTHFSQAMPFVLATHLILRVLQVSHVVR